MTTTTGSNGRLGNQIIRNLAVSLVAQRHDLKVEYHNHALIEKLGIQLHSGARAHQTERELNDANYFSVRDGPLLTANVNANGAYFQTRAISRVLHAHLQQMRPSIMQRNPFKERYNANDDLFVHVRLTDAAEFTPGIGYYARGIDFVKHANLYLATDQKSHSIVQALLAKYPHAQLVERDEIATFQFASTCRHVLLSHGSFSAVIGYLAFFSDVYYPEYKTMWYGDMFSIANWTRLAH